MVFFNCWCCVFFFSYWAVWESKSKIFPFLFFFSSLFFCIVRTIYSFHAKCEAFFFIFFIFYFFFCLHFAEGTKQKSLNCIFEYQQHIHTHSLQNIYSQNRNIYFRDSMLYSVDFNINLWTRHGPDCILFLFVQESIEGRVQDPFLTFV